LQRIRRLLSATWVRLAIVGLAVIASVLFAGLWIVRGVAISSAETALMILHKNGIQKPEDFGAASELVWVQSSERILQASIVRAPSNCSDKVAVLLFHGRGETISDWAKAQAFLSLHCISSMVFDYSGHGSSTPPAHIATLNVDAVAAYLDFVKRFPVPDRRCILGHSMGVAPMLNAYPSLRPAPDCVVAANGFSSLEDTARAAGAPAIIAALLQNTWNNVAAISAVNAPLLLIHSDSDEVIAPDMSERLDAAAPVMSARITQHGFAHNAIYQTPTIEWWGPVLKFLHDPIVPRRNLVK
jgi:alpha-beta hydrolase superfamily lysophospholipase